MKQRFKKWWYHEKSYPNGSTFTRGQRVIFTCFGIVALVILSAVWLWAVAYLLSVLLR